MTLTRGIRNNNPFNIKRSSNSWLGKLPPDQFVDDTFEVFCDIDFGLRAGIILLHGYIMRGFDTPFLIISRFAPSSENDTSKYIDYVCKYMHVDKLTQVDNVDYFYLLCAAVCNYESRYCLSRKHFNTILQNLNINLKFHF